MPALKSAIYFLALNSLFVSCKQNAQTEQSESKNFGDFLRGIVPGKIDPALANAEQVTKTLKVTDCNEPDKESTIVYKYFRPRDPADQLQQKNANGRIKMLFCVSNLKDKTLNLINDMQVYFELDFGNLVERLSIQKLATRNVTFKSAELAYLNAPAESAVNNLPETVSVKLNASGKVINVVYSMKPEMLFKGKDICEFELTKLKLNAKVESVDGGGIVGLSVNIVSNIFTIFEGPIVFNYVKNALDKFALAPARKHALCSSPEEPDIMKIDLALGQDKPKMHWIKDTGVISTQSK